MSRSYSKTLPGGTTFRRKKNKRFRARCRVCIRKETINPEFGETVFPHYKKFFVSFGGKDYVFKNDIRQEFNLEISQIINGYSCKHFGRDAPKMDKCFIETVNEIKGVIPEKRKAYRFEWLDGRKTKRAIKAWRGNPFDVISYLTRHGLIEQEIRRRLKMRTGK